MASKERTEVELPLLAGLRVQMGAALKLLPPAGTQTAEANARKKMHLLSRPRRGAQYGEQ